MEKKRIYGYDLMRALAILLVMLNHACMGDLNYTQREVIRTVTSCSAVLFFMISGALLMPIRGTWKEFLFHRFKRVMIPAIFWTVLFALVLYVQGRFSLSWTIHVIEFSWLIPVVPTYWFVFIISSIYLFMPIISPWLEKATKRQLEYFVILWLLGGLGPWLAVLLLNYNTEWNSFYMFTNYFGYCMGGYYLSRYPLDLKQKLRSAVILGSGIIFGLILPLWVCYHPGNQPDIDPLVSNDFSFTTYLWGCFLFAVCLKVKSLGKIVNFIVRLYSRNAFGMFLCHTQIVWAFIDPYYPELRQSTPLMFLFLITVPMIVSEATRRIPWIGSGD